MVVVNLVTIENVCKEKVQKEGEKFVWNQEGECPCK